MAEPGDEIAAGAGGHSHLRASHADREQVIDKLKAAFVQGRLPRDEFDLRVGQALASQTYADLVPLENRIQRVTCSSSGRQAACMYSLIRPPRRVFGGSVRGRGRYTWRAEASD